MEPTHEPALREHGCGRPVYLALEPDPVLGFLHLARNPGRRTTGVLLCPPFGWEDVCSYRSRRTWASALAQAGYHAARFDLPGTGDSGGSPRDQQRMDAWTGAVTHTATWLRASTGCTRVVAVGHGLGGMVACRALLDGAPVDDLVLWGVPSTGRALLRELRAFSRLAAAEFPDPEVVAPPPVTDGSLEAAGFFMSAETVRTIEELDLASPPPGALGPAALAQRRLLLLGRDGIEPDGRLGELFERGGAEVTIADGPGYGALMTDPQRARTPHEVFALTMSWLQAQTDAADATAQTRTTSLLSAGAAEQEAIELNVGDVTIRESPLSFDGARGRLLGVLCEPTRGERSDVCAVLLNAGAARRIGPNRMWVEVARRWAARGVPSVRIDLEGLGDSDGDGGEYVEDAGLYTSELTRETLLVLDQLEARGLPTRFVLAGLCSGAYWSFHAARRDQRVVGALMVNLYAFYWDESEVPAKEARRIRALIREGGLRWLSRRDMTLERIRKALWSLRPHRRAARRAQGPRAIEPLDLTLDSLRDRGTEALLLLSRGEQVYDELARMGTLDRLERWPNLRVEQIPCRDHTFRAIWLQRHVHAALDDALERTLQSVDGRAGPSLVDVLESPRS